MEIAIISDLHFGIYNDDEIFIEYQLKCLNKFLSYIDKNNIKKIFILGDVFDRRKYINFKTLYIFKKNFFDKLISKEVYILLGNHDIYYKNSLEINSLELLLREYKNIKIIKQNEILDLKRKILIIPWLIENNFKNIFNIDIVLGHFEFQNIFKNGINEKIFKNVDFVFSGHYHIFTKYKNIIYVGSPYQLNFLDLNVKKGFIIFDLENNNYEFIEIDEKMFYEFNINDKNFNNIIKKIKYLKNKIVRVNLDLKDQEKINYFYEFINFINFKKIQINQKEFQEIKMDVKHTNFLELIDEYIDTINFKNKKLLKKVFLEIYKKANDNN